MKSFRPLSKNAMMQFSLRQFLAFVMFSSMLLAVLVLQLEQRRQTARSLICRDQLRATGLTMLVFADKDPRSRYCSGAYDWQQDGCPDTSSWVGDQDTLLQTPPALFCPANQARGSEGLQDLISLSLPSSDGVCGQSDFCGKAGTAAGYPLAQTRENRRERISLVAAAFLGGGLNTNYTPSWLLVRTAPRVKLTYLNDSKGRNNRAVTVSGDITQLKDTLGPLTMRFIALSPVASNVLPLLADGGTAGQLAIAVKAEPTLFPCKPAPAALARGTTLVPRTSGAPRQEVVLANGQVSYKAICMGDALFWEVHPDDIADDKTHPFEQSKLKPDTRGWSAVHVVNGKTWLNMLMADGSVREFEDLDGDKLLNPGFAGSSGPKDATPATYRTSMVELADREFNSVPHFEHFLRYFRRHGPCD